MITLDVFQTKSHWVYAVLEWAVYVKRGSSSSSTEFAMYSMQWTVAQNRQTKHWL